MEERLASPKPRGMASPSSRLQPQKVVSFKLFELEQKGKLKSAYPFLSADQINRKMQDLWKRMENKQKQNYTRLIMKSTPIKKRNCEKSQKAMHVERKRKLNSSGTKAKKAKFELTVSDTPETINTKKLNDFRKEHVESYENDFSDFPVSSNRNNKSTPRKRTYAYSNRSKTWTTPDGSMKQAGILKLGDSEKKNGDRSRVSFYSPAEIRERSQETEDTEYDRFSDDDDAGLLIRRDDVMESSLDQLSTEHLSSIGAVTHDSQSDDDDDEMSGLLIRREEADDYDHIDRHKILIDDGYENIGKFISIEDTEEKEATRITDDVASPTEHSGKEISNMKHTKDGINCVNEVVSSKMGTEADEDIDDDFQLFKSPLPSVSKRSQRNKSSKRKSKKRKVDIGSESLHTPATWSVSSKHSCQQVTPILTCNQENPDSYTTPLMDEFLQQLTFDEASKAPQKRRQSSDNHTSNVEKLKALHSGRRVTRSLLVTGENQNKNTPDMIKSDKQLDPEPKSKTKRDLMVGSHQMDPRGDAGPITPAYALAKMETSEPSASNCHSMPDQYQPKSQESGKSLKRNRHSTPGHHQSRPRESTIAFKRKIETHKQRNQSAFITNKARKEMSGLLVPHYNSPDVDESPDLLDICNSYGSPSSDSYRSPNQSQYTNPALEKALRNLRCTAMSSPSLSVEANSDVSSPGLLSPTLSGVSELSSTSSGPMDHDKITKSPPRAMDNAHCKMLTTEQMQPRTRSMDLCQLFNDVTPPDKKTKGPYRTQRIVSSGPCTDDKNFRQLFEDSDSLFC